MFIASIIMMSITVAAMLVYTGMIIERVQWNKRIKRGDIPRPHKGQSV